VFSKRLDLLEDSEPELRLKLKEKSEQVVMSFFLSTKFHKENPHNIPRHLHDCPQLYLLFKNERYYDISWAC
jgi:hypothetical protein